MNSEALGVSGAPGVRGIFRTVESLGSAKSLGCDDSFGSEDFPGSEESIWSNKSNASQKLKSYDFVGSHVNSPMSSLEPTCL